MKVRFLTTLAALVAAPALSAAVLVSFDMTTLVGDGATKGVGVSIVADQVSSTDLLKNNLTLGSPTNTIANYGPAPEVSVWTTNTAQATLDVDQILDNANYITFTVTPEAGYSITIDSITFQAAASSNSTVRSIYLFSSATGFNSANVLASDANALGGGTLPLRGGGVLGSYAYNVTAEDPAFTGITGATEFRIYLQTGLAGQDIDLDNIIVNGSVASIPEAGAFAVGAAMAALGFAGTRRRR